MRVTTIFHICSALSWACTHPDPIQPAHALDAATGAEQSVLPSRLVAVGDLHGDITAARATLRLAGLIDADDNWSGDRAVLVQTGDTTDRGPSSRAVLELMMTLERQAHEAGGRVVSLLGNHEVMNIVGDWRYVSPEDVSDFGGLDARKHAFSPTAPIGKWLRSLPVTAREGNTVFAHGGITPEWAERGLQNINARAASAMHSTPDDAVLGTTGPLWYRDYLLGDEQTICPLLIKSLDVLKADRMVVGHTTQRNGRIATRCEGRIVGIDTGISAGYGGNTSALEIRLNDAVAVYPAGRVDLPDPPGR